VTGAAVVAADVSAAVVRAEIASLRSRGTSKRVVALRGRPHWTGPDVLEVDGEAVRVVPCMSALAVRDALRSLPDRGWLVVITDRDDADLGDSLCARFARGRVRAPNLWDAVGVAFRARQVDRALTREGKELAEVLLAEAPAGGWPPARAGALTRDAAFEALSAQALSLPAGRIDVAGLLEWSLEPGRAAGLRSLTPAVSERLLDWLGERTGPAGRFTMQVVRAGNTADALPLALVAGLLASPEIDPVQAAEARGLLAHRYGGQTPTGDHARGWAEAARGVVERRVASDRGLLTRLDRAEAILASANASQVAGASPVLRAGMEARLHRLAITVRTALDHPADRLALSGAEATQRQVAGHVLAAVESPRVARSHMALRLLRWLATDDSPPATIAEAVARHVDQDGWVDRARADVWVGDDDPAIARAYAQLYDAVTARRASHDEQFARLLAEHLAANAAPGGLLHVENVVRQVVLPLATRQAVLLLVVDGMSVAVAAELADGMGAEGWQELVASAAGHRTGALAPVPTVTEVARTSLLSGRLARGGQDEERAGLLHLAREVELDALLFHRGDLERTGAGDTLAPHVRGAVEDASVKLVAVVLNAVDDALDRSDVGGADWGIDQVKHLRPLLTAARNAGRTVVLTSDHGHVVERRAGELRSHADAESARWRTGAAAPAGAGEIALVGRRVLHDGGVIAPWAETLRYLPVRAGYHGGVSPAEVVTPLLVFGPGDVEGWQPAAPQSPPWWLGALAQAPEPASAAAARPGQISLFELAPAAVPDLADQVLASPVYASQRERARRTALDDGLVRAVLRALIAGGGRQPQEVLASVAQRPMSRFPSTMAALQRYLNVEGYEVVGYDADGVTVVLDEALLRQQFDLES
jgi:PglZ domain